MPDVPGFGVWQLDTSSFYSIVNINSCLDLIKRLCGRISFIPLTLSLEPQLVEPPGIKRKTVHILQIRSNVKLAEIQRLGRRRPEQVLLPPLEEEEIPSDLFPEEVLAEAKGLKLSKGEKGVPGEGGQGDRVSAAVSPPQEEKPVARGAPPAAKVDKIVGDGFSIDLTWLNESLKSLKWSELATRTFLVGHYKVDGQGTIPDILKRLTRAQAEDFVKEIHSRLEKQPKLI
jgi:hypothetical protein